MLVVFTVRLEPFKLIVVASPVTGTPKVTVPPEDGATVTGLNADISAAGTNADITLTIYWLRKWYPSIVNKVLIVDLDAHQGNGHERSHAHHKKST